MDDGVPTLREYAQVIEWIWERLPDLTAEEFPDELEAVLDDALHRVALWKAAVTMGAAEDV